MVVSVVYGDSFIFCLAACCARRVGGGLEVNKSNVLQAQLITCPHSYYLCGDVLKVVEIMTV